MTFLKRFWIPIILIICLILTWWALSMGPDPPTPNSRQDRQITELQQRVDSLSLRLDEMQRTTP